MRTKFYLIFGAGLVACISAVNAATIDVSARNPVDAQVVAKTSMRLVTGMVQKVEPGGVIRLREHSQGDVQLIVTKETTVLKGDQPFQGRDIHRGTRLHASANFRGGKYYAKVIHID